MKSKDNKNKNKDSLIESALRKILADSQWHVPAQADDGLGSVYQKLLTFKNMFDQMHEIPNQYEKVYTQIGKALDLVVKARQETTQLREMTKKLVQRF